MTARSVPSLADYLTRWSSLHGGFDPASSFWVHGWLRLAYALARPFARRAVSPHLVTLLGVLVAAAVPAAAAGGARWPLVGALAAVVVGMADGVDGAVAVLTDRVTRAGAVLDAVADRTTDVAFFAALWLLGGSGPWCAAAGALTLVAEYARARAGAAGVGEVGVVTVWERPTRIIVTSLALAGAAGLGHAAAWGTGGAVLSCGLALVGAAQLARFLRQALSALD